MRMPEAFFDALYALDKKGVEFNLVLLGENFSQQPECFDKAKAHFGSRVLHYGFVESFEEYAGWLHRADILPVTSQQDFFGGSVVEAMYCGCTPLLPDRLAFPAHIPKQHRSQHLYQNKEGFVSKLEEMILNYSEAKVDYQEWVEKYDWKTMAPIYDSALSAVPLPK